LYIFIKLLNLLNKFLKDFFYNLIFIFEDLKWNYYRRPLIQFIFSKKYDKGVNHNYGTLRWFVDYIYIRMHEYEYIYH
jgi:hypothetical protein